MNRANWKSNPQHFALLIRDFLANPQTDAHGVLQRNVELRNKYSSSQIYTKLQELKLLSPDILEAQLRSLENPLAPNQNGRQARKLNDTLRKNQGAQNLVAALRQAQVPAAQTPDSDSEEEEEELPVPPRKKRPSLPDKEDYEEFDDVIRASVPRSYIVAAASTDPVPIFPSVSSVSPATSPSKPVAHLSDDSGLTTQFRAVPTQPEPDHKAALEAANSRFTTKWIPTMQMMNFFIFDVPEGANVTIKMISSDSTEHSDEDKRRLRVVIKLPADRYQMQLESKGVAPSLMPSLPEQEFVIPTLIPPNVPLGLSPIKSVERGVVCVRFASRTNILTSTAPTGELEF